MFCGIAVLEDFLLLKLKRKYILDSDISIKESMFQFCTWSVLLVVRGLLTVLLFFCFWVYYCLFLLSTQLKQTGIYLFVERRLNIQVFFPIIQPKINHQLLILLIEHFEDFRQLHINISILEAFVVISFEHNNPKF